MTIPLSDMLYAASLLIIVFIIRVLSTDPEKRDIFKVIVQSIIIAAAFLLVGGLYALLQDQVGSMGSNLLLLVIAFFFGWYCYIQYQKLINAHHKLDKKYKGIIRELKKEGK